MNQNKRTRIILTSLIGALLVGLAAFGSSCLKQLGVGGDSNDLPFLAIQNIQHGGETVTTSTNCTTCHAATTDLGYMIKWAQDGWEQSVHKNGYQVPILAGGAIIGWEWEGTDAFYSNGGGCQTCHTHEGFRKKIAGAYADSAAVSADVIEQPSSIGCFTCHDPHEKGDMTLTVSNSTTVTLETGAVYSKSKGSLCASCHMARLSGYSSVNERVLAGAVSGYSKNSLPHFGPHYGPQTDVLLGVGGATYTGKSYGNSAHSLPGLMDNANCITCHMTAPSSRASLSPGVGGHSFEVVGIVHGAERGNTAGCATCHSSPSTGTVSTAAGYFHDGDVYLKKDSSDTTATDVSNALVLLADPGNGCAGLLQTAYNQITGGTITFSTDNWKRCSIASFSANIAADAAATETTASTRFLKALWNWKVALEDRSWGAHNKKYILQLLYDSCDDLKTLTSGAENCGTRPN